MNNKLRYRVLPRWLKNTEAVLASDKGSNAVEFCWVMFEILGNDMKTATPLCYFASDTFTHPIGPLVISIADKHDVIDVLQAQLPPAIL